MNRIPLSSIRDLLKRIASGGQGVVYDAPNARVRNVPRLSNLVYKEYKDAVRPLLNCLLYTSDAADE